MAEISAEQLSDFAYQRLPDIYKVRDFEIDEERPPLLNFLKAMFLGSGGITKAKKYTSVEVPKGSRGADFRCSKQVYIYN